MSAPAAAGVPVLVTRLKQVGVVLLALVIAAGMVRLGWWQLDVYRQQAEGFALQRAAEPARPLGEVAPPGELPEDGYGRTVTFTGEFSTSQQQFLLPVPDEPGRYRVLSALVQADGSTVPVVRGVATLPEGADPPAPPSGPQQLSGILLASEARVDGLDPAPGELASVRLSEVAQSWDPPLVNGFVTLDAEQARAEGLDQAAVTLPEGEGELRNGGYALQWWVFAGFGLVLAVLIARDIGRKDAVRDDAATGGTGEG